MPMIGVQSLSSTFFYWINVNDQQYNDLSDHNKRSCHLHVRRRLSIIHQLLKIHFYNFHKLEFESFKNLSTSKISSAIKENLMP